MSLPRGAVGWSVIVVFPGHTNLLLDCFLCPLYFLLQSMLFKNIFQEYHPIVKKYDSSSRLITPSLSSNCLSVDFKIGTCRQRVNIYFIYLIQHVLVGYEMVLMM